MIAKEYRNFRRSYSLGSTYLSRVFLVLGALFCSQVLACPGAIFIGQLPHDVNAKREALRLFAAKPAGMGQKWLEIPFQIDSVDDRGRLVFDNENSNIRSSIKGQDLVTFKVEDFGAKATNPNQSGPCKANQIFEIQRDRSQTFAYLAFCDDLGHGTNQESKITVAYDETQAQLQSERYVYKFNTANYMLFDTIKFRRKDGIWEEIASDSRMLIRADAKHFFTMHFDSRHIESKLEEKRIGPVASLARVSFFLRVLFLKIKMSLATDVGFFLDSGHIPMLLNLPVDANKYLHYGSGILYSWKSSTTAKLGKAEVLMPRLDPHLIKLGTKNLAEVGLRFCRGETCMYRYTIDLMGQILAMDIGIERSLVEKGFFPFFVEDVSSVRDTMGWSGEGVDAPGRNGMYFEVSGLEKGEHPWDFWLRLGAPAKSDSTCPEPLSIRKI